MISSRAVIISWRASVRLAAHLASTTPHRHHCPVAMQPCCGHQCSEAPFLFFKPDADHGGAHSALMALCQPVHISRVDANNPPCVGDSDLERPLWDALFQNFFPRSELRRGLRDNRKTDPVPQCPLTLSFLARRAVQRWPCQHRRLAHYRGCRTPAMWMAVAERLPRVRATPAHGGSPAHCMAGRIRISSFASPIKSHLQSVRQRNQISGEFIGKHMVRHC